MTLYTTKPHTVEAVQWTGSGDEVIEFGGKKARIVSGQLEIRWHGNGSPYWVDVPLDYWLVRNPDDKSNIWTMAPDDFAAQYELVTDGSQQ
jgi:hypothetical protein